MRMKKIISISVIVSLTALVFLMVTNQEIYDGKIVDSEDNGHIPNDTSTYNNHIEFNQEDLQLKKEVVQYKITFHQEDAVEVSTKLAVLYVDEMITSAYCLLTNGEKPLFIPQCQWYFLSGTYH